MSSRLWRNIAFQVQFRPIPRLTWARSCKLGYWRESRRYPFTYRRMMAFERRHPQAPYRWAPTGPHRVQPHRITDFLRPRPRA
jgi:hypothetical protein